MSFEDKVKQLISDGKDKKEKKLIQRKKWIAELDTIIKYNVAPRRYQDTYFSSHIYWLMYFLFDNASSSEAMTNLRSTLFLNRHRISEIRKSLAQNSISESDYLVEMYSYLRRMRLSFGKSLVYVLYKSKYHSFSLFDRKAVDEDVGHYYHGNAFLNLLASGLSSNTDYDNSDFRTLNELKPQGESNGAG